MNKNTTKKKHIKHNITQQNKKKAATLNTYTHTHTQYIYNINKEKNELLTR